MAQKKKVEALSRRRLAANAFRVLGVHAGASQAEVEAAARKMRIWTEAADIPATPWDLPWLGELSRGRNEIEQAVACLNEPESRIDQRLFWFSEAFAGEKGAAMRMAGHDPALAEVAGLMVGDENFQKVDKWGKALAGLRQAACSPNYRDWFLNVERDGDFEKRAEEGEVVAALAGMQESIAQSVAARMNQFIDAGDLEACLRLVQLLPAAGVEGATGRKIEIDVCNRVEDLLIARCIRLCDDLHRGLSKPVAGKWSKRRSAKKLCAQVEEEIQQSVHPLEQAVIAIEGANGERMRRIGVPAARMMRNLWIGWSRAGRPAAAKQAMRRAQHLARGTPLEAQLLAEARPKVVTRRKGVWWRFALPVTVSALLGVAQWFPGGALNKDRPIQVWTPPAYHMPAAPVVRPFTPSPEAENPAADRPPLELPPRLDLSPANQVGPSGPAFPETPLNFDSFGKKSDGRN